VATRRFDAGDDADLDRLYSDLAAADLQPLWTQEGLLTPAPPQRAVPFCWKAKDVWPLAERARHIVPIERGGDRRVLMFSNPGMGGRCFATSTMSAAVQILGPGEVAPAHRHTAAAIRFVLEGTGACTLVNGDSVPMTPGDLVLTPNWTWHEHHNPGDQTMLWLDVLDLALVIWLDAMFFEPGADAPGVYPAVEASVSEGRYGRAGIVPLAGEAKGEPYSPLFVYRWADTDAALAALVDDGATHASIRYTNPSSGADVMPTLRCEAHRLRPGDGWRRERATGATVWTVVGGEGLATVGDQSFELEAGDSYVVPSWSSHRLQAGRVLDLFTVGDAPVLEALGLMRREGT
jgi:gentisate 1,2-dioxygenase